MEGRGGCGHSPWRVLKGPPLPLPEVWDAWLGFVLERRRKKARLERAVQAYHQQLLQEGTTCLLRFAAGMRALRQQLHAQQQVQVGSGSPAPGGAGRTWRHGAT